MSQTSVFRGTARAQLTVNGARHYVYHRTAVVIVNPDRSIRLALFLILALFAPEPPEECFTDSCVGCIEDCGAPIGD